MAPVHCRPPETKAPGVSPNTQVAYEKNWNLYIKPAIGKLELQHVTKNAIEVMLGKMADDGKGVNTIKSALIMAKACLSEAYEAEYIDRNPARKATLPRCKPQEETRSLTEDEVRRLLASTEGRDRLWWSILTLTGIRISELLALDKADILPDGLRVSKSALYGHSQAGDTKSHKMRMAPLTAQLRKELAEWAAGVGGSLLFPTPTGNMHWRQSGPVAEFVGRGRTAASIPDLTPRMCRTTFATLWGGDLKDAQSILGHHDLKMTMDVYRRPILERQQAASDDLAARLSGKVVTMRIRA